MIGARLAHDEGAHSAASLCRDGRENAQIAENKVGDAPPDVLLKSLIESAEDSSSTSATSSRVDDGSASDGVSPSHLLEAVGNTCPRRPRSARTWDETDVPCEAIHGAIESIEKASRSKIQDNCAHTRNTGGPACDSRMRVGSPLRANVSAMHGNRKGREHVKGGRGKSESKIKGGGRGDGVSHHPKQGKDVKYAHVHVHLGQQCKGGTEQRVNRVGKFEAACLEIEKQGAIAVHRVSEASMHKRKMALNIDRIVLLQHAFFYDKMNASLKLPSDKVDKKKLCSGVRETMRYLGMLPGAKGQDGRLDWGCDEFVFNDEAREERLARAILTHRKGEPSHAPTCSGIVESDNLGSKAKLKHDSDKDKRKGEVKKTAPACALKGAALARHSLEMPAPRRQFKDKGSSSKIDSHRQVKGKSERASKIKGSDCDPPKDSFTVAFLPTGKTAISADSSSSTRGGASRGLIWVKKGIIRGGVKFREHIAKDDCHEVTSKETRQQEKDAACGEKQEEKQEAVQNKQALPRSMGAASPGATTPETIARMDEDFGYHANSVTLEQNGEIHEDRTCGIFLDTGAYNTPDTNIKRSRDERSEDAQAKRCKFAEIQQGQTADATAAAGLLMLMRP